jgi:hypothetical protein
MAFAHPPISLLCKLGSIAVHADELTSPHGHKFDESALRSLLDDAEVKAWLHQMNGAALIPRKRN